MKIGSTGSIGNLGLCTSKVRVHVLADEDGGDDDDANDVAVAKHQKFTSSSFEIQPPWYIPYTYVEDETRDGRPSNGLICLKRPL